MHVFEHTWESDMETSKTGYRPITLLAKSSMQSAALAMLKGNWPKPQEIDTSQPLHELD